MHISSSDTKYIPSLPRPRVNIEFIGQLFRILSSRDFQMLGSSASILLYYVLTGNFAPIISLMIVYIEISLNF